MRPEELKLMEEADESTGCQVGRGAKAEPGEEEGPSRAGARTAKPL